MCIPTFAYDAMITSPVEADRARDELARLLEVVQGIDQLRMMIFVHCGACCV